MDDHVVFFLGSGMSRPSGMPTVGDITQKVLDAPLVYTERERYVFPGSVENNPRIGRPKDSSRRHVAKLRGFLGEVRQHAQTVLCEDEEYHERVTYEDLYALCGEIVSERVVLYVDDMCARLQTSEMSLDVVPNLIWDPPDWTGRPLQSVDGLQIEFGATGVVLSFGRSSPPRLCTCLTP
jgi:hypothetical protein